MFLSPAVAGPPGPPEALQIASSKDIAPLRRDGTQMDSAMIYKTPPFLDI